MEDAGYVLTKKNTITVKMVNRNYGNIIEIKMLNLSKGELTMKRKIIGYVDTEGWVGHTSDAAEYLICKLLKNYLKFID